MFPFQLFLSSVISADGTAVRKLKHRLSFPFPLNKGLIVDVPIGVKAKSVSLSEVHPISKRIRLPREPPARLHTGLFLHSEVPFLSSRNFNAKFISSISPWLKTSSALSGVMKTERTSGLALLPEQVCCVGGQELCI